jgi:hypothetical protein
MSRPKRGQEHPREEYRDKIRLMTAIGIPHAHIASLLGRMSLDTLHKFYREELDTGSSSANAVVGGKIFEAAKRGEQWACTLWAVRRMGWKETSTQELTGKDGGPIEVADNGAGKKLLDELARLKSAGTATPGVASDGASKPNPA